MTYTIDTWTQHWRRIAGRPGWYRDAVVVLANGERRLVSFPEGWVA